MQALSNVRTLVTGGTGFVGLRTVSKLLSDTPTKQIGLAIRADSQKAAKARLMKLTLQHPGLGIQDHLDRIEIIPYNGANIPTREYDALLNLASDTAWTKPLDEMLQANCAPLEEAITGKTVPKHVVHCSTAYARPLEFVSEDTIAKEESFPEGSSFFSPYAQSKYQCERMIESNAGATDTCYSIVRPSTVGASVGVDSMPRGWTTDMKGLAGAMYLASQGMTRAPVEPKFDSNVLPVDHVANTLIASLLENVVRNSPTLEYIHAAPGDEVGLSWGDAFKRINPSLPLVEDAEPTAPFFPGNAKLDAAGKILYTVAGRPFRFQATKQDTLLKPLLTDAEQKTFCMKWGPEDNLSTYFQDATTEVQKKLAERAAAKKQSKKESVRVAVSCKRTKAQVSTSLSQ
ncbi:Male sterility protein [Seminavis robusta]|uniref:Fatty acyl-CoA reductase n=1 Tax=Seminavis robusta TaxID=568900 RepID=A0A9N8HWK4_9STRA|nr:Male sterility protein [Seminavis robusta]|eukprot:Sro1991_g309780.1 Male sterility protein (402) ;mRNA; r:5405-6610